MTMQHPETYPNSQRGATRQTRRAPSLRALLKSLMDGADNPHSTEDRNAVLTQFQEVMHGKTGQQYLDTLIEYWFTNNYRSLLADYPESGGQIAKRQAARAAATVVREQTEAKLKERLTTAIERKAQVLLLDTLLPNGKTLRDSTFRECAKMGGALATIAKKGKPSQIVGDVLKDADLRKLQRAS